MKDSTIGSIASEVVVMGAIIGGVWAINRMRKNFKKTGNPLKTLKVSKA